MALHHTGSISQWRVTRGGCALVRMLLAVLILAGTANARAQSFPATYVGFLEDHCGEWIAEVPGCWAFIDFQSPWKFFPDNDGRNAFAAFIPQGQVVLDSNSVIDDTGVVIPFLGVEVATLALGGDAHLVIATAGSLKVEGFGGIGGLITNDGRITLQGSAVLETPFAAQLLGGGEIVLDGESSTFRTLGLLSQADGHVIRGEGNLFASALLNEGAIVADRDARALKITGALLTNDGLLRAGGLTPGTPGGELRLEPLRLVNSGEIVAEDGFIKIEDSDVENTGLIEARALGTIVLQDVDVEGAGGTLAVRSGGAFTLNGSNRVDGGSLVADAGAELAIGPGTTTLTGNVALQGVLATRGGTLRFDAVDLTMPGGTIEVGAGMLAQSFGAQSTFHGGSWRGAGVFDAFGATSWDATSGIHNQGLAINLHLANHRGAGTIRNDGTMSLVVDTGFNQTLSLLLDGDLAFEGGGTLRLRGSNGPSRIAAAVGGSRLRNGAEHLLRVEAGASATIQANTTNAGTLEVRGANAFLTMPLADLRNTGLLGAYDGGVLTLRDTGAAAMLLHNTDGVIEAGAGSRIVLSDGHPATSHRTTIRGGTLAGAGAFEAYRFVALDGATDGALTIASGGTVRAFSGSNLYLTGDIVVNGRLDLADTTGHLSGPGTLWIEGDTRLGGSGETVFSIGNEMRILGTSAAARLEVGAGHRIAALANTNGQLDVHTTNLGRIEARGANAFLTLPTAFIRNAGTIGAFDGGVLTIRHVGTIPSLVHNTGGRIEAGAGSRVILSDGHPSVSHRTTIRGGTLAGAGAFEAYRFVALDGATDGALTIASGGTVRAFSGSNLYLTGDIVVDGRLDLADTTGHLSGPGTLWIEGATRLRGSGDTVFSTGNEMRILGTSTAARLEVGAGHRVAALANTNGLLDVHTTNLGRIEARGANAVLTLPTAFVRNSGVLGAYEGGVLTLRDPGLAPMLLDNTGGSIEAGAGSRVILSDGHPATAHFTTIRGGTLTGSGRFDVARLVYLDGATSGALTIAAGGTVRAGSQAGLFVTGNLVNDGTIDLRDETGHLSGNGTLWIDGSVDLAGTGSVDFTQGNEMRIRGTSAGARLGVGAAQTIGVLAGAFGTLDVHTTNLGRIEVRGANAVLALPTAFVRNSGVLGAYEGGVLTLRDAGLAPMLLDNAGGVIEAGAGSRVILSDGHPSVSHRTTLRGGTLAGDGRFDVARLVAFDGATDDALTIAAGASVRVGAGANLFLAGTIVNDGLLELMDTTDHTSGAGVLWVEGAVDLAGSGRTMFTRLNEMHIRGTDASAELHVGAQQTIGTVGNMGVLGTISVAVRNEGRIEARGTNAFLAMPTPFIRNTGVLGAYDGGTLTIRDTLTGNSVIDNLGGRIEAGTGSRVVLSESHPLVTQFTTVQGGTLGGPGRIDATRLLVLDGATRGALTIETGGTVRAYAGVGLYLAGRIVNDGTIDLYNQTTHITGPTLWVNGDVTLDGAGRVQYGLGGATRIAGTDGTALLRVSAEQTIVALANTSGTANVDILSAGVIEARGANAFLTLDTDSIVNRGRIGAEAGGTLRVGAPLGLTVIDNRGGELHAGAGSQLILQGATHPSHTATTVIRGGEINGTGTVFMNGRVTLADGVVLSPGNSPGVLTVEGNLALDPLGALKIEIQGPTLGTEYDQLLVRGQLSMDGMLEVLFPSTYRPTSTDVFTLLSATQLVGAFDNVRDGRVAFRFGSFDVLADRTSFRLTNFVAVMDPVDVPAPSTLPLLLGGALCVLVTRGARKCGTHARVA